MLFKSSIGIEINDLQVNILYLKGSFKGLNPAVASSCRLEPGKSVQDRQADIVSFVNEFILEEKISAADVFIGISAAHTMMREIEFPMAVRENLQATLTYEIEKYIPVSADDIYFDYQVISENKEEEKLKLLLVAVKKDILEYYLEIVKKLDTGVSGIEIVPSAISNYCYFHQEIQKEKRLLFLARDSGYDVAVLNQGSMVYAKSIALADVPVDHPVFIRDQLIQLRDTFFPAEENSQAILYGVSESDGVFLTLSDEFQHLTRGLTHSSVQDEQFIPAFGLALNGIGDVPVKMNLMPASLRKKPNKTGIYVMFGLAGLLVLSGLVWAGSHLMVQRAVLQNLDAELARLRKEATVVEKIQAETELFKNNIRYFRALRPGGAFAVEIAEELSRIIPSDAYLTEMKMDKNKISLYGTAESASGLISLLEESPLFENVEFISATRKGRDGKDIFRIKCIINAGK